MARRQLTARAERALIAEAESVRDADTQPTHLRLSAEATSVLSVRLPMAQLRILRALAVERGVSLSALLQEAVERLVATAGASVSVSDSVSRFWVSGATIEAARTDAPEPVISSKARTKG